MLKTPTIAFACGSFISLLNLAIAQPQRIERNVARSKATLAQTLSEASWKDGETVKTQGRFAAGDDGGQDFIYHANGWSGLTASQQAATGFFVRLGVTDKYLEAIDKSVIHWARWGLVADGTTDDASVLQAMVDATQLGYSATILLPQNKTILVNSAITLTNMTKDVEIIGNGSTIVSTGKIFDFTADLTSLTLASDVAYNSTDVSVADATGVNVEDILYLASDTFYDTSWNYTARDVRRIESISGNVVSCVSPTNLSYSTTLDTISLFRCKKVDVFIRNCHFNVTNTQPAVALRYVSGELANCNFSGNLSSVSAGLALYGCVDLDVRKCTFDTWVYGSIVNYSRFVRFSDIVAKNCSTHPVVIAAASSHIVVDGLVASGVTSAAVESHPAFYVTYRNVTADRGGINCRALGVTLENITITNPSTDNVDITPVYSQLNLSRFTHLDEDYSVRMSNVNYLPDTSAASPVVGTRTTVKKWVIQNCQFPAISVGASGGFQSATDGLFVSNSKVGFVTNNLSNTAVTITDSIIDKTLLPLITRPLQVYATSAPMKVSNVQFSNWDTSDTVCGAFASTDLTFVNCSFGTFADFCTSKTGSGVATDWKFVNCELVFTADDYANFDLNTFVNCKGSVAGNSLTTRGGLIDEDTFLTNSAILAPSQQSTKAYVDVRHGHAQISIEDNATATTVASTQSDWSAKSQFVGFGTNFADSSNATPDHTNDHITLTSAGTWEVTCVVTLSGSVVSDLWELALWKNNGATQVSTKQGVNIRGAGLTYEKQVTISGLVDASANDTIELWVQRTNGTGTLTITNAAMVAKKVSD